MILRSMTPRPVLLAARRTAASAGSAVIGSSRSLQPTTGSQRNIHNVTIHSETEDRRVAIKACRFNSGPGHQPTSRIIIGYFLTATVPRPLGHQQLFC